MNRPIIVFDFDKTLTYKDTLYGFYEAVSGDTPSFKVKYVLFLFIAILAKVKLISNDSLKKFGIKLFLKGKHKNKINKKGKEYASSIKLNRIYSEDFKKIPSKNKIIVSASFEEYLKPVFPDHLIIGSKILFDKNGRVKGLDRNLYGERKLTFLHYTGVEYIDVLYTDSYADKPLMEISKCVYLVKGNKKKLIKGND